MDELLMAMNVEKILENEHTTIDGSVVFWVTGTCQISYRITQPNLLPTIRLLVTYDSTTTPNTITAARAVMMTVVRDPKTICDNQGERRESYDAVGHITTKRLDKALKRLHAKALQTDYSGPMPSVYVDEEQIKDRLSVGDGCIIGIDGTSKHIKPDGEKVDFSDLIRRVIMRHITRSLDIDPIVCRDDTCDRAVYKLYGIDGYCIELTTYNVGSRDENRPVRLIITIKDLAMNRAVLHKAILVDSPLDAALLRLEQYHNYLQNNDRNKVIGMLQDFCKVE